MHYSKAVICVFLNKVFGTSLVTSHMLILGVDSGLLPSHYRVILIITIRACRTFVIIDSMAFRMCLVSRN